MLEDLISSFSFVFIGEMGDKTQLLTLILVSRYRQPWVIASAIFVATLLNHAFAVAVGQWVSTWLDPQTLKWILVATFLIFAVWILIPDKEEEPKFTSQVHVFMATLISFFLAEMGDKTQLVTVALAAKTQFPVVVTMGTTLGMMAANGLALVVGQSFLDKLPMKWIRLGACLLFVVFAILIALN